MRKPSLEKLASLRFCKICHQLLIHSEGFTAKLFIKMYVGAAAKITFQSIFQ